LKQLDDYTFATQPDDNGTFVAHVPAIPGCHAWGPTPEEARAELVNVFEMIQEEFEHDKRPLPEDVKLTIASAS
jgi:predicted RNase H-like HicB family nuclease